MSDFVDQGPGDALQDVTNHPDGTFYQPAPQGPKNKEASAEARAKGWVAPTEYDYSKYVDDPLSVKPVGDPAQLDAPEWAAKAAKYEWNDEYGDVGPANPDLEQMLFHNDLINRTGLKMDR